MATCTCPIRHAITEDEREEALASYHAARDRKDPLGASLALASLTTCPEVAREEAYKLRLHTFAVPVFEYDPATMNDLPEDAPVIDDGEFLILDPSLSICTRYEVDPIEEYGTKFLNSPFATEWHWEEARRRLARGERIGKLYFEEVTRV